jgi:hypothetical protein
MSQQQQEQQQQQQPYSTDARMVNHQITSGIREELLLQYRECITHALHLALGYPRVPEEVILTLLAGNRDAAKERNTTSGSGELPLHMALESKYSDRVILALLAANSEAAMVEAAHRGDLPLHQAIKNGYSEIVIMEIFLAYPSAVMIRCKQTGMLPLHLAASSNSSPILVKAMINEYPEALDIKVNNSTPRDLVTSSLPVESMKMICRPSMYWLNILSTVAAEKAASDHGRSNTFASDSSTNSSTATDEEISNKNYAIGEERKQSAPEPSPRFITEDSLRPFIQHIQHNYHRYDNCSTNEGIPKKIQGQPNLLDGVAYSAAASNSKKSKKEHQQVSISSSSNSRDGISAITNNTGNLQNKLPQQENLPLEEGQAPDPDPDPDPKDSKKAAVIATDTTHRLSETTTSSKEDDGDRTDSESTTTLSDVKSTTSIQQPESTGKGEKQITQMEEEEEEDRGCTSAQAAATKLKDNLQHVLLQDYHAHASSSDHSWQELVARLEQQQGHRLQLHHEAAYLPLATMAAAHRYHDTTIGTQYNSSIRPIVLTHTTRENDYFPNGSHSSIVTPLLRNFIQHDYYDQHLDGVSREIKRMKQRHSDEAPDGFRDSARAAALGSTTDHSDLQPPNRYAKRDHARGNPVARKGLPPGLTAMGHLRHYVQHNYHDHANDAPCSDESNNSVNHSMPSSNSVAFGHCDRSASDSAATDLKQHTREPQGRKGRSPFGVTPMGRLQNVVQHNYHDHSDAVPLEREGREQDSTDESGIFPVKLHSLLENVEVDGHSGVVSWQPHGRAFKIHNRKKFVEQVMPKHFRQSKFESFRRQLCLYGFLTITQGVDKGALYHELFLRGRPFLAKRIKRQKLKGTVIRTVASPETEPDFYSMPYVNGGPNDDR